VDSLGPGAGTVGVWCLAMTTLYLVSVAPRWCSKATPVVDPHWFPGVELYEDWLEVGAYALNRCYALISTSI